MYQDGPFPPDLYHPLRPASGASQHGVQASHSPPLVPVILQTSKRSSLPHVGLRPRLQRPTRGPHYSLPRVGIHPCFLPFPLNPLLGAQVLTQSLFFPSYVITCVFFLQPWLYRSPYASFQVVFSENCSTCRCIFDVFVGECDLHILLLCHLD